MERLINLYQAKKKEYHDYEVALGVYQNDMNRLKFDLNTNVAKAKEALSNINDKVNPAILEQLKVIIDTIESDSELTTETLKDVCLKTNNLKLELTTQLETILNG